jgi:hypothetical protein
MIKAEAQNPDCCRHHLKRLKPHLHHHGSSNPIYGLGVIGALFYFLQNATTFSMVVVGIFKAIFWPAFVLFRVLTLLSL